jgi:hypothetical protein
VELVDALLHAALNSASRMVYAHDDDLIRYVLVTLRNARNVPGTTRTISLRDPPLLVAGSSAVE